jgi:hypothetical protein
MAPSRIIGHDGIRHDGGNPASRECHYSPKKTSQDSQYPALIRWSLQEMRRIACEMSQRSIEPAAIIAWSLWRRAHQAVAQQCHIKQKMQL